MSAHRAQRPDFVRCAGCWTIYAPTLHRLAACPKCGSPSWVRTAIPDGPSPLGPPVQPSA